MQRKGKKRKIYDIRRHDGSLCVGKQLGLDAKPSFSLCMSLHCLIDSAISQHILPECCIHGLGCLPGFTSLQLTHCFWMKTIWSLLIMPRLFLLKMHVAYSRIPVHNTPATSKSTHQDSSCVFGVSNSQCSISVPADAGLICMQRSIIVPPELGYGSKGLLEIPPNATIELQVQVLSVKA